MNEKRFIELLQKKMDLYGVKNQTELGEICGLDQSRISLIMNPDKKGFFTLEQIGIICKHFDISLDDIFDLKKEKCDDSLSDVEKSLFQLLDANIGMSIDTVPDETSEYTRISFNNQFVVHFLKQLKMMAEIANSDSVGMETFETWKKATLEKDKMKLKLCDYKSIIDCGKELVSELDNEIDKSKINGIPFFSIPEKEYSIIEKYMEKDDSLLESDKKSIREMLNIVTPY